MVNDKPSLLAVLNALETLDYKGRSYSGRAMYGRSCLGIETDRYTSAATVAFRLALQLVDDGEENLAEDIAGMEWREDSLGLGGILYLPDFRWIDGVHEDEDEECDCEPDESCQKCA